MANLDVEDQEGPSVVIQGDDEEDVFLVVMGLTGTGKSSFINLATQSDQKLAVTHSIKSCTDSIKQADPFYLRGRRVILYDTPGFDNTAQSEDEVLRIIALGLKNMNDDGLRPHGLIYLHRISDIKVGGIAKTNFRAFRQFCGDDALKNVVIVTTMWDKIPSQEGTRRGQELKEAFFAPALAKGARLIHNMGNTVHSARDIISTLLENQPISLAILQELVLAGNDVGETLAGREIDKRLKEQSEKYEKKLREQADALMNRDQEKRDEAQKAQVAIDKLKGEVRESEQRFQQAERQRKQDILATEQRGRRNLLAAEEQGRRNLKVVQDQLNVVKVELQTLKSQLPVGFRPGTYSVINERSGKALDLAGYDHMSILCSPRHSGPNQQWVITSLGNNTFSIRDVGSGRYISYTSARDDTLLTGSYSAIGWHVQQNGSTALYTIGLPNTQLVWDHADYGRSKTVKLHHLRNHHEPCQYWRLYEC